MKANHPPAANPTIAFLSQSFLLADRVAEGLACHISYTYVS